LNSGVNFRRGLEVLIRTPSRTSRSMIQVSVKAGQLHQVPGAGKGQVSVDLDG
jgi:hypothetical protein